jgi:superfamily II DNA or RNA helicase
MAHICKLVIEDECNAKFEGLDLNTRKQLKSKLEFLLPHARHTPAYRLGRWDGKVGYCTLGGRTYLHLLDDLLPIIVDAGYEIVVDDHRKPYQFEFGAIDTHTFSHKRWPQGHPAEGDPIILRDYQAEILEGFAASPQSIQEVATGSGKTLMTAAMSSLVEPYGRSIVIVPNKDLVTQTEKDYRNLGLDVGVFYGERKEYNRTHTICTWQSLEVLIKNTAIAERDKGHLSDADKMEKLLRGECWCCDRPTTDHANGCVAANGDAHDFVRGVIAVIVDEVHRASAEVLRTQLKTIFRHVPIRWGLTGTVPKADHERYSVIAGLGPVVGKLSSKTLQDRGVLAQLDIEILQLQDPIMSFGNYAAELKWLTTNRKRLDYIRDVAERLAKDGNTLILVDRIETGRILVEHNPDWVFISGQVASKNRQSEYDDVSSANNKVIVATYGVAAVGINIPRIFNLMLIEPGKSFVRVIQSIGRGIRKAKDKDSVRIFDLCSSHKYSKRHLTERKKYYREQQFPFKITKVNY